MQIILDGEQHLVVLRLTGAVVLKQQFCTGFPTPQETGDL